MMNVRSTFLITHYAVARPHQTECALLVLEAQSEKMSWFAQQTECALLDLEAQSE